MRRAARLAGLIAAALLALAPSTAVAKPPVWVVRSPSGATLTLFGSVHLLPAGLDWRPAALDDALIRADEVWFELPITPKAANEAAAAELARGALPRDRRLTAMLTPDQTERLVHAAEALHCAPEAVDRMQPWMADYTLSVADDARSGADASSGVEHEIEAAAGPAVRRRSFETAAQQIEFLAGASVKDQLASLNWTVSEIVDDPSSYDRLVAEWMDADLLGLKRDANDPLERVSPGLYQREVVKRNRRWAGALADRMRAPGEIVVVVGIGHMIGADGLPALLRARGLRVEGPV
ncbi:MAG TPA: TraB/GumN family protein [Caulobacteraceae bacterium]|jgi:hypothetical protein